MKGGVWDPSMEPAHCRKSYFSLNPLTTSFNSSPAGNNMYTGINFETMALHIKHTVHLATPNRCATVRYSAVVARIYKIHDVQ